MNTCSETTLQNRVKLSVGVSVRVAFRVRVSVRVAFRVHKKKNMKPENYLALSVLGYAGKSRFGMKSNFLT